MPVIQITLGKCDREHKRALIEKFTAAGVEITGVPASEFTVFVHELEYDNIGRSGKTLTEVFAARNTK